MIVGCAVLLRQPAPEGHRYQRLWPDSWAGDGRLRLPETPAVGDRLWVYDDGTLHEVVVLERRWEPAQYRSAAWRAGKPAQTDPMLVTLVCGLADASLMADEYDESDDRD